MHRSPEIELLVFDGCPNEDTTRALVERVAAELNLAPKVSRVVVPDVDAAERMRFLGSPTIRVNGHDIEPGADGRNDYALACRVYRAGAGVSGQPDEDWLRQALSR
jgi:hypothetical protein